MNKERQRRQIIGFLQGKGGKDVDAFTIYQWIDRCYAEEWWDFGIRLSSYVPPNSLGQEFHKRLNFLVMELRSRVAKPMSTSTSYDGAKLQDRDKVIIFNVGWMTYYRGLEEDEIERGGAYITDHGYGGEIYNFLPFNGFMYGYVQPPGRKEIPYNKRIIRIERLGVSKHASSIDGILVVWVATSPDGGSLVVGWYKEATVFRFCQHFPDGLNRTVGEDDFGFYAKAKEQNCILLPVRERTLQAPRATAVENRGKGGIGQANVWYADSSKLNDNRFVEDVKQFINNYYGTNYPPIPYE